MHRYHKSYFQLIWPFYGFLQLYEVKLQKSHISVSSVHKYHKSCSELIWPFYDLLQLYEEKLQKSHISVSSVHKYHKSYLILTNRVLSSFDRFTLQLYEEKLQKISYLREFSAQVSQIVFCHLTVLRLITTVWGKSSKISYLREFSAQVSQIVFWAHLSSVLYLKNKYRQISIHLTVLRLIPTVWVKLQKSHISVLQCTSITNRVLSFIWPFYGFLQLYEVKLQKSHISVSSVHKWSQIVFSAHYKSCSELIWPFYDLLQLYEVKLQKSHISVSSVHKYHKSCSEFIWPFYDFLQLYEEKLQKSHISVSSVQKYKKSCSRLIWPF